MATTAEAVAAASAGAINVDPYLESFAARGPEGRAQRRVLAESVEDLKKSGFMRSTWTALLHASKLTIAC